MVEDLRSLSSRASIAATTDICAHNDTTFRICAPQKRIHALIADTMLAQQRAQFPILIHDAPRSLLDLGAGFDTLELALVQARFELLEVFLAASARPTLVVADACKVGFFLCRERNQ